MKTWQFVTIVILAVAFAVLVWPTPYRYDPATWNGRHGYIRTNRVTGSHVVVFP